MSAEEVQVAINSDQDIVSARQKGRQMATAGWSELAVASGLDTTGNWQRGSVGTGCSQKHVTDFALDVS